MSISNSDDFVNVLRNNGIEVNEHVVRGRSVQLAPGTYVADYRNGVLDSVTFSGTTRGDTLFGGGGEAFAFFMGTRGNDLYGTATRSDPFSTAYTDYSHARTGVSVNMDYHGVRTFTDAGGKIETIAIIGKANDGLGGTDYFAASAQEGHIGFSSIAGIFGSAHRDVMIGDAAFYGGGGNDFLISSSFASGGTGNDRLVGRVKEGESWILLSGDEGNDVILGAEAPSNDLSGDAGNDRIFAGSRGNQYLYGGKGDDFMLGSDNADMMLTGQAGNDRILAGGGNDATLFGGKGNDFIDAGAGNDFAQGGVGADVLLSGAGNDIINPDVEFFQKDASQARDGARDVIRVTKADLGDFTDVVVSRAFEEDRDQIRFAEVVKDGTPFRVYHEDRSFNPDTGRLWHYPDRAPDRADIENTVLQIDQNHNGFGDVTPDKKDYFLVVIDADLSLHRGDLLT